ncbi:hypothetical protein D3C81_11570 [compost metagenome]
MFFTNYRWTEASIILEKDELVAIVPDYGSPTIQKYKIIDNNIEILAILKYLEAFGLDITKELTYKRLCNLIENSK